MVILQNVEAAVKRKNFKTKNFSKCAILSYIPSK